jgi:predicted RecA/RadA family phage recombinase
MKLSPKQRREIAVANRLIKNLAPTFVREGDHTKNEPDVIYSHEGALLGIEVATAYTDDSEAEREWGIARGKIEVPKDRGVRIWRGEEPDNKMCARIQQQIDEKCGRKPYSGVDRVWLCIDQIAGLSGDRDAVLACVKRLHIPTGHGFEKIFLHYLSPIHEDNEWRSIELWPMQRSRELFGIKSGRDESS